MKALALISLASTLAVAQTGTTTTTKPKPKTATHATTHHSTHTTAHKPVAKKPVGPIDATKFAEPVAHIHTTLGDMTCKLDLKSAPETVKNFIQLSQGTKPYTDPKTGQQVPGDRSKPYYNGVIFHRVIPEFMVQTGDPTGTGEGNPGFRFDDELTPAMHFDAPGKLAMANAGPNTNGSQFFITEKAVPFLDPCFEEQGCQRGSRIVPKNSGYTLFGQCDAPTVDLVQKIARLPKSEGDRPADPPSITSITFTDAAAPTTPTAKATTPAKKPVPNSKLSLPRTKQQ